MMDPAASQAPPPHSSPMSGAPPPQSPHVAYGHPHPQPPPPPPPQPQPQPQYGVGVGVGVVGGPPQQSPQPMYGSPQPVQYQQQPQPQPQPQPPPPSPAGYVHGQQPPPATPPHPAQPQPQTVVYQQAPPQPQQPHVVYNPQGQVAPQPQPPQPPMQHQYVQQPPQHQYVHPHPPQQHPQQPQYVHQQPQQPSLPQQQQQQIIVHQQQPQPPRFIRVQNVPHRPRVPGAPVQPRMVVLDGSSQGGRMVLKVRPGQVQAAQPQQGLTVGGQQVRLVPLQTASPQAAMAALRGTAPQPQQPQQPQSIMRPVYRPLQQQQQQVVYQQQHVRPPGAPLQPHRPPLQHQPQQHWPHAQPPPSAPPAGGPQSTPGAEIQYNVEHVFEENGKEVRKMPINLNGETIWADCVPQSATAEEAAGGGIMLDLDDGTLKNVSDATPQLQAQPQQHHPGAPVVQMQHHPQQQQQQQHFIQMGQPQRPVIQHQQVVVQPQQQVQGQPGPVVQPSPVHQPPPAPQQQQQNQGLRPLPVVQKRPLDEAEKDRIFHRVIEEKVSPAVVAEETGHNVVTIRNLIKDRGGKLPSRYTLTQKKPGTPSGQANNQQFGGAPATNGPVIVTGPGQRFQQAPGPRGQVGQQQPRPMPPGYRPQTPGTFSGGEPPQQIVRPGQQPPQRPGVPTSAAATATTASGEAGSKEPYKAEFRKGQLVLCKHCGFIGADFNQCIRCKKKIPEGAKVIDGATGKPLKSSGSDDGKVDLRAVRINQTKKRKRPDEPVCIALSSDEDDDDDEDDEAGGDSSRLSPTTGTVAEGGKPSDENKGDTERAEENAVAKIERQDGKPSGETTDASAKASGNAADPGKPPTASPATGSGATASLPPVTDKMILEDATGEKCSLPCRSIRVGSYKSMPKDKAVFTEKGIHLKVPDIIQTEKIITLNFLVSEVIGVRAHFGKQMPILFMSLTPRACLRARQALGMKDPKVGLWLDGTSADKTMKQITILPERMNEESKGILSRLFSTSITDIDSKVANELLVASSPKDNVKARLAFIEQAAGIASGAGGTPAKKKDMSNVKCCQFPLTGKDSVTVTMSNYLVLEDEGFLNDVIIDFYLRYLQYKVMSEVDRDRTHVFSTFFYEKLTKRPSVNRSRLHDTEDNPNLSPAEKRYERVRRWTKKINLFEKDFIIVPINEHSHWFLAVICFPGLDGCRRMDDDSQMEMPDSQKMSAVVSKKRSLKKTKNDEIKKSVEKVLTIGSTSIIPLKGSPGAADISERLFRGTGGDDSDRDEAEASDEDMMDEEDDPSNISASKRETPGTTTPKTGSESSSAKKEDKEEKKEDRSDIQAPEPKKEPKVAKENNDEKPEPDTTVPEIKPDEVKKEDEEKPTHNDSSGGETKEKEKPAESDKEAEKKPTEEVDAKKEPEEKSSEEPVVKKENETEREEKKEATPEEKNPTEDKKPKPASPTPKVAIKQPCILIFDSLSNGSSRARVAATLRDYLQCEYNAKVGGDRKFDRDTMKGCCPRVPQQPNFSDCGIFVLQYVESFFKTPIKDYSLPVTNLKNWFTTDTVRNKRSAIATIIRDLTTEQNPQKQIEFPNLVFTPPTGSGYTDDEDDEMPRNPLAKAILNSAISSVKSVAAAVSSAQQLAKSAASTSNGLPTPAKPGSTTIITSSLPPASGGSILYVKQPVQPKEGMLISKVRGRIVITTKNGVKQKVPMSTAEVSSPAAKTLSVTTTAASPSSGAEKLKEKVDSPDSTSSEVKPVTTTVTTTIAASTASTTMTTTAAQSPAAANLVSVLKKKADAHEGASESKRAKVDSGTEKVEHMDTSESPVISNGEKKTEDEAERKTSSDSSPNPPLPAATPVPEKSAPTDSATTTTNSRDDD